MAVLKERLDIMETSYEGCFDKNSLIDRYVEASLLKADQILQQ